MWDSSGGGHWESEPTGAFSLCVHILPMATKLCLVSGAGPVQEFLSATVGKTLVRYKIQNGFLSLFQSK